MISNKKTGGRRGAPKKEIKRKRTNITLEPSIKRLGEKIAFDRNKSMSRLFEDMILGMAETLGMNEKEGIQ